MENMQNTNFDLILDLCYLDVDFVDRETKLKDIESLLGWVDSLNEVNVENIEPLTHLHMEDSRFMNDIPEKAMSQVDVLHNAPSKNANYITIPR